MLQVAINSIKMVVQSVMDAENHTLRNLESKLGYLIMLVYNCLLK